MGSGEAGSTVYRTMAVRPGDEEVEPERKVACPSCGRRGMAPRPSGSVERAATMSCTQCGDPLSVPACIAIAVGMTFVLEVVSALFLERSSWVARLAAHERVQCSIVVMGLCVVVGGLTAFVVGRRMRLTASRSTR